MTGQRFHIDGTQEFGYFIHNRFLYSFYMYMNTVKRVSNLYHNASVLDLKGYVAHFCYIRLKSFDTFFKVVVEHKDYVTANCILRMLGDCVAIFRLIYGEPNPNYLLLRHALYVIDGCERNLAVLTEENIIDGCLPDEELKEARRRVRFNREHRQRLMHEAQELLTRSTLPLKDKASFDTIVKDRNWKFKEFKSSDKKYNQYKWRELYDLIGKCQFYDLLSYISQYAHGLSMSNLVTGMNQDNFDGVVGEAVGLIDRLQQYTLDFFADEYQYIRLGLLEPKMRDKLLACYDDEHRPSIEEWNQKYSISIN